MTANASLASSLIDYLQHSLAEYPQVQRWYLGLSGGLDSVVLLHAAVQSGLLESRQLQALHINHQLQAESDGWAEHCWALCQQWSVPIRVIDVDVSAGAGPEDQARRARYQVFESLLTADTGLLLAHHADDQAETLLMRLIRGSGPKGLAGIPASRALGEGLILRPLLPFSRQQLETYAGEAQLRWIDDPSNADPVYDRNFLRHQIIQPLQQRWPELNQRLAKTAAFCAEADDLLTQLAEIDHPRCQVQSMAGNGLAIDALKQLPPNRQRNLLRHWLSGFMTQLPEAVYIDRILSEVIPAREDADPAVTFTNAEQTYQVRRHQHGIYLIKPAHWQQPEPFVWDGQTTVHLPGGTLSVEPSGPNSPATGLPTNLSVRFRQGGEQIKLAKHGRPKGASSQLKKWLQNTGMPSWQRDCLPLIYAGDELVVVPDFGAGMLLSQEQAEVVSTVLITWKPSTIFSTIGSALP